MFGGDHAPSEQNRAFSNTYNPMQSDDVSIKRQKQAEYAEEILHQIRQKQGNFDPNQMSKTQPRVFMSSLSNLYGNRTEELERKKRQQEIFAETLRQQIEEKRRLKMEENKKTHEIPSYSSIASQASQLLETFRASTMNNTQQASINLNNNNNTLPNYQQMTKITANPNLLKTAPVKMPTFEKKPLRKPEVNFAETVPISFEPNVSIEVSTESPFTHSKVATPPLGFSLRKSKMFSSTLAKTLPANQAQSSDFTTVMKPPNDQKSQSSMAYTQNSFNRQNQMNKTQKTRLLNNVPPVSFDQLPDNIRLGTNSELVYPDGHISPLHSSRV